MDTYFGKTAMLKNTRNDRKTDKGVNESLDAFVASNKIHMRWNGNTYVGNALGMEFTTPGPKQLTNKGRY
jgi:hypothetical protein